MRIYRWALLAGGKNAGIATWSDRDQDDAAKAGIHVTNSWSDACTHFLVVAPPARAAADAHDDTHGVPLATRAAYVVSGKPAVSMRFLRAVRGGVMTDASRTRFDP